MKESVDTNNIFTTTVNYSQGHIGDYGANGYIYNFAYFDVYDDQGNLLNGATESSYTGTGYNDGLAQWDYATYEHYPRRDYAYVKYIYSKEGHKISHKYIQNEKYQSDRWTGQIELYAQNLGDYGYDYYGSITKFDIYDLLPSGMYLDDQNILIDTSNTATNNFTINGERFSSSREFQEFIKSHTSYEIKYNWNNTGRTWIHIYSDFTDVNLQLVANYNDGTPYVAKFKVYIPYESIPENGLTYKNYAYINLEPNAVEATEDKWDPAYYYSDYYHKDSGYFDSDAVDINENGSTTDLLNYSNASTTLLEAYASQGALTKYVRSYKMDGNNKVYNNEWDDSAITEPNGYY